MIMNYKSKVRRDEDGNSVIVTAVFNLNKINMAVTIIDTTDENAITIKVDKGFGRPSFNYKGEKFYIDEMDTLDIETIETTYRDYCVTDNDIMFALLKNRDAVEIAGRLCITDDDTSKYIIKSDMVEAFNGVVKLQNMTGKNEYEGDVRQVIQKLRSGNIRLIYK